MFDKLKQLKNLQSQASQIKETLANESIEGVDSSNKIKIIMDGNQKVLDVKIDSELIKQPDRLQSALAEAFNNSTKKVRMIMMEKLKDIGLPGGIDMPEM